MAWTAPRTWTDGELVTASILNTHVRDNLLATEAGKVTTAGDIVYATAANTLARLGVGTSSQVLHGGASAPAWGSIATADIADDAVDDSKVGNRVPCVADRQGGSATNWATAGTTDYSPDMVRMQVGMAAWTGGAAASGSVSVTFPTAFSYTPVIVACSDSNLANVAVSSITASGCNIDWATVDASTMTSVNLLWFAVGPE